jgi:hypothetical protein
MESYLARYQQGDCEQVWSELYTLGAKVRREEIYPEAWAVALETMRRVRHNVEVVTPRLEEVGYEFGYEWLEEERPDVTEEWVAWQPARDALPSADIAEQIQRFEELAGPLPLSIRAFYREVGEVNFFGRQRSWERLFEREKPHGHPPSNLDPLAVRGLHEDTCEDYVSWQEAMQEQGGEADPYPLLIAVDYELKYDVSGSGAYEMEVPNASADALLLGEWHQTTFVNYLRICLHYGGLPGLQYISHLLPDELAYLRKDLLSI